MVSKFGRFFYTLSALTPFSALLALCAGNSPVTGEFPSQRPVTRGLGVFFDMRLNKRLSKQSWGLWFETPSRPLWRHCNDAGNHSCQVEASWERHMKVPRHLTEIILAKYTSTHDVKQYKLIGVDSYHIISPDKSRSHVNDALHQQVYRNIGAVRSTQK